MFETLFFWVLLLITAASFYLTSASQFRIRAVTLTGASLLAIATRTAGTFSHEDA